MAQKETFLIGCCWSCGRLFDQCECDGQKRRDRLLEEGRKKRKASSPHKDEAPQKIIQRPQTFTMHHHSRSRR